MYVVTLVWFTWRQLSWWYWSVVRHAGDGSARLQLASSRPVVHRGSGPVGETLYSRAVGQTGTLERRHHGIGKRRGSIVAVFSRVAGTTSPLQLRHCLVANLVLWFVECPVPEGHMSRVRGYCRDEGTMSFSIRWDLGGHCPTSNFDWTELNILTNIKSCFLSSTHRQKKQSTTYKLYMQVLCILVFAPNNINQTIFVEATLNMYILFIFNDFILFILNRKRQ